MRPKRKNGIFSPSFPTTSSPPHIPHILALQQVKRFSPLHQAKTPSHLLDALTSSLSGVFRTTVQQVS